MKAQLIQLKALTIPAIIMSLDFRGAFDSVWHPLVLCFFRDRGLPSNVYSLLQTFLEDRHVVYRSFAGEVEASPSLGSPQGSLLSPLLWNVVIHNLLCLAMPPGVTIQAYADEMVIIVVKSRAQWAPMRLCRSCDTLLPRPWRYLEGTSHYSPRGEG